MSTDKLKTLPWLLRREYWEHKGGLVWAPIVTGIVYLGLMLLALVLASTQVNRHGVNINGVDLSQVVADIPPDVANQVGASIDFSLYMTIGLIGGVLFFVAFFYCLGTLYDDRRDRSILFWKSMPISDTETVLSKVAVAAVGIPVMATIVGVLTGLIALIMLSAFAAMHGANTFGLVFGLASPLKVMGSAIAILPVAAVWALPTIGWLMLCSAAARSKPFLWALALPIGTGVLLSWFDLLQSLSVPDGWFWQHVVGRLLLSIVPGSWISFEDIESMGDVNGPYEALQQIGVGTAWSSFTTPEMWIGALAGALMIAAAIWLRRRRSEV